MKINTPTNTVLYAIEETIKAYRKLSAKNISEVIPDITVDQALILLILDKNTDHTQMELADLVFKDYASITRILKLMEKKGYLTKTIDAKDKRRSTLTIADKGKKAISLLAPVISLNRTTALNGLTESERIQLFELLKKITKNCTN
ncbi:DNA-binding transcriptional regulator, MarR family [Zhouia amylolytica]|uniref:DNA-binding transcriptional regulator, MarR family n=1 Tax=Zhouia amylolytica TaxID=376730 RepID=A0A1I6UM58_9FLAO|nr:MarR family transcriptional regulator [Zhouia amylolytica]MCQ0110677.1 MarR family transcriptional regulator [Zhouia amylolytica]SFT02478.1 DNA-binding transcriptional regulator, MarR family [Zhouia amylolytica]